MKIKDLLWLIIGTALGVGVCTLSYTDSAPDGIWYIFFCGALSICAMILPGISGSFILMVMGKYEYIMESITGVLKLDLHSIIVLLVFAAGCVIGLLAFAKLLHWLLDRWNRQTLIVLCGFVIGSLVKVWPWHCYVTGDPHVLAAIICCLAGIVLVLGLEWLGKKNKNSQNENV